jgi:hypothetical protein
VVEQLKIKKIFLTALLYRKLENFIVKSNKVKKNVNKNKLNKFNNTKNIAKILNIFNENKI